MSLNNKAIKGCMKDILKATEIIKEIVELESDVMKSNNKIIIGYALDRINEHAEAVIKRIDD